MDVNKCGVPLFLHGSPGIGKTDLVRQAAEVLGVELIVLRVNLMEPTDFLGFPMPVDGQMKFLPPEYLPKEGTTGLLFLDEFPQAPIGVQCAAMRLIDHLPSTWQVVAAGNKTTDRAGANQIATHVLSRFTSLDVDVDLECWQKWALDNGVRREVRGYLNFRRGSLFEFDAATVQKARAFPSPRSWHRVSRLLDTVSEDVLLSVLGGTVGEGKAAEFFGYLKVEKECPPPADILKDPAGTMVPRDPAALFAICASLADYARKMPDKLKDAMGTYLARLPVEFGALLITDLLVVTRSYGDVPTCNAWIRKHMNIIVPGRS